MAEKTCIHCGANCMRSNLCQCGSQAFKELDPDKKGSGTVIKPVVHKTLMCDRHKQYLVLSMQRVGYNVYRCNHGSRPGASNCYNSIRVYGDEL